MTSSLLSNKSAERSSTVNILKLKRNDVAGAVKWNCKTEDRSYSFFYFFL